MNHKSRIEYLDLKGRERIYNVQDDETIADAKCPIDGTDLLKQPGGVIGREDSYLCLKCGSSYRFIDEDYLNGEKEKIVEDWKRQRNLVKMKQDELEMKLALVGR